jgi:hypothetical protein
MRVELALRDLNRPLAPRDFLPITEALHREFRGTTYGMRVRTDMTYFVNTFGSSC